MAGKSAGSAKKKKKYAKRVCLICGAKFTPRQYNQFLCGDFGCRAEYLRWLANGYSRRDLEHMLKKNEGIVNKV